MHNISLRRQGDDDLHHELMALATEGVRPGRPDLDTVDTLALVRGMNEEDATVPLVVASQAQKISVVVDELVGRFQRGGRLFYIGSGTPGRIGILDASECPPTFGTDPGLVVGLIAGGTPAILAAVENAEDNIEAARAELELSGLQESDTVVGISASGRTPYVVGGLEYAKSVGAYTVSIASNPGSPIANIADIAIELVLGPEFVSGSTRLKSGTAQKLVLNMLTTITMIKLGKTYNGYMVDLRATNRKLQSRSELTVAAVTGLTTEGARHALSAADGSVKLAIMMVKSGLERRAAQEYLDAARGILRIALLSALEASKTGAENDDA